MEQLAMRATIIGPHGKTDVSVLIDAEGHQSSVTRAVAEAIGADIYPASQGFPEYTLIEDVVIEGHNIGADARGVTGRLVLVGEQNLIARDVTGSLRPQDEKEWFTLHGIDACPNCGHPLSKWFKSSTNLLERLHPTDKPYTRDNDGG